MNPITLWHLSCVLYQKRVPVVPRLLKTAIFLVYHAILPCEAVIGPGLSLEHYGLGIVVHPNVTLGANVRIYHHVTLAAETWIGSPHRIFVGDNVTIGAGAIILARPNQSLTLGDGASVGAGAVVTRDVPAGVTVVGSPARPLPPKPTVEKTEEAAL